MDAPASILTLGPPNNVWLLLRRSLYAFGVRAMLIEPSGYNNTTLLSRSNLERSFSAAWNQTTPEVKAEFGELYFKTRKLWTS